MVRNRMKVAAIQMNSGPSVDENLEVVSDLVADAAAAGAKLVVLPENACLMAVSYTHLTLPTNREV